MSFPSMCRKCLVYKKWLSYGAPNSKFDLIFLRYIKDLEWLICLRITNLITQLLSPSILQALIESHRSELFPFPAGCPQRSMLITNTLQYIYR